MKTLINYFMEANLALMLFYVIYRLSISNQSKFRLNRFILLSIPVMGLAIPFLSFPAANSALGQSFQINLPTIHVNAIEAGSAQTNPIFWLVALYSMVTLAILTVATVHTIRLLRKSASGAVGGYRLSVTKENSFSFFNRIYLNNELTGSTRDLVLLHEKVHADEHHTADVLFYELVCALFWCNPAVWLLRREIRINHEYLVDARVKSHCDQKTYLEALLGEAFHSHSTRFFSTFNHSQTLKKRIDMMIKTPPHQASRYMLAATMAFVVIFAAACADKKEPEPPADTTSQKVSEAPDREVFDIVDQMPEFMGGQDALFQYLGNNISYPETAKENATEGAVYISFVIETDGSVTDINVLRGIGSGCDAEAIRVISEMPKWNPGVHKGQVVPVLFNLPIRFQLTE